MIITDSLGYPLGIKEDGLTQLGQMGYNIDKINKKIDMVPISDIALLIKRSENIIHIVAHTHGKKTGDKRPNRYYFFYKNNGNVYSRDFVTILKDFVNEVYKTSEKHNIEIINTIESLFIFKALNNTLNYNLNLYDSILFEAANEYLNKNLPLKFETNSIKIATLFLINLDFHNSESNYLKYIIYLHTGAMSCEEANVVNIYINHNRTASGIEPIGEFKTFYEKYKLNKYRGENPPKINKYIQTYKGMMIKNHLNYKNLIYRRPHKNSNKHIEDIGTKFDINENEAVTKNKFLKRVIKYIYQTLSIILATYLLYILYVSNLFNPFFKYWNIIVGTIIYILIISIIVYLIIKIGILYLKKTPTPILVSGTEACLKKDTKIILENGTQACLKNGTKIILKNDTQACLKMNIKTILKNKPTKK